MPGERDKVVVWVGGDDVLGEVGQGSWHPRNDPRPWIRFSLTAHYHQARTHLRRIKETEGLFVACSELAQERKLPERVVGPIVEAAFGFRLRNSAYREIVGITDGDEISELTASRDLRAIVDAKLLEPVGKNRGRYYLAQQVLLDTHKRIHASRESKERADPFALARDHLQLTLT